MYFSINALVSYFLPEDNFTIDCGWEKAWVELIRNYLISFYVARYVTFFSNLFLSVLYTYRSQYCQNWTKRRENR